MERLTISGVILVLMVAGATAGESNPNTITKTFHTNSGLYGVASIAGVTSRNGRVSSVSGVKFYPSPGSQQMNFFYPNLKSGEKLPEPISFSKEENGRITSGSIKIGPGSVSVSSSARSAYPAGASSSARSAFPTGVSSSARSTFPTGASSSVKFMKPMMVSNEAFDDMFFPYPLTTFNSRSFDPWFPNDLSFRQPPQPRFDAMSHGWPYPRFSPFNYW